MRQMPIADGFSLTPDEVKAAVGVAHDHQLVIAICLVLLAIAVSIVIVFRSKGVREFISDLLENRSQSRKELDAANDALRATLADFELSKIALSVAADTVERFNRIRFDSENRRWSEAHDYLLGWIRAIFGFQKSDINKVTIWRSNDGLTLYPLFWSGMTPEAANVVRLTITPGPGETDTFAAMAFRGGAVVHCDDIESDARFQYLARKPRHPYASLIAAPIFIGDNVVAVLTIDSLLQEAFSGKDAQRLAKLCAALIALLLDTSEIHTKADPESAPKQD